MFKRILFVVSSLFFLAFYAQAQNQDIDLTQAVIIDVRTQAEWQEGHLENASLMPWQEIVRLIPTLNINKNQPIALFCRSGNRASKAMTLLNAEGYTQVINLGSLEQAAETLGKPIVK